jgi:hypothetical protein
MDRLYRGNAEDARRIGAIILFDDVMIIALITGQKPMKLMWNQENVTRYNYCCTQMDATDGCFIGKDNLKWAKVKSSTHIRRKWQNMKNFPWVISQAKKATTSFEAWNYLIIDGILGNTVPHTN